MVEAVYCKSCPRDPRSVRNYQVETLSWFKNTTDYLTCELMPKTLVESKIWWNRPIWIRCSELSWLRQVEENPECEECKAEEMKETYSTYRTRRESSDELERLQFFY